MNVYMDWQQSVRWAWSLINGLAISEYTQKSKASTALLPKSQTTDTTLKDRALYDQTDLISSVDGGAITLITIQYNLFVGTVAPYADGRPDLQLILDRAMKFEISGQFLLTEVGHGLDARNLETTATLLPNRDFELHSPNIAAAKCMPPTTPRSGLPSIGVVMAKLMVEGEDYGVRAFLVPLADGKEMCKGVTSNRALPPRTGAHPIDHALTYFDHVRLPSSALLGPIAKPKTGCIPLLKNAIYNASLFSMRRKVRNYDGKLIAVMSFRTQHLPILHAIAQYHVLQAFFIKAATEFRNPKYDARIRHAFATVFKAVALQHFQKSIKAMNDGCGWHGYFEHNQILQSELEFRAVGTAEGDIRVLAITQNAGIDPKLIELYESGVIKEDSAWYSEQGGLSRKAQFEMEAKAADALLPDLESSRIRT
ncbi:hypothetical protein N8T08_005268 [Aspergillus melleus]|uniref:Uncharacterized protein n=1 Tax=Aspergillus melleus TaxID=138277 RepID=A0ACC3BFT6_9EURO|nr:hypothetical protein N8T08_005268 [Aspergillus melleus]